VVVGEMTVEMIEVTGQKISEVAENETEEVKE